MGVMQVRALDQDEQKSRTARQQGLAVNSAFEPEATAAMAAAFDKACLTIYSTHQSSVIKEIIARQIIALAQEGETDVDGLCVGALQALGLDRSGRAAASSERLEPKPCSVVGKPGRDRRSPADFLGY
jgi:hypothetical protein